MDKPWKIILLLAAIFAMGATTGGLLAVRVCKDKHEKRKPPPVERWAPERLRKLEERLKLTPEQVEVLKPIMRRDMEQLGQIRGSFFAESRRVIERMERDIATHLTPEQQQEFEKVKQESAERWRKMMEHRGRGGRRGDHGAGGREGPGRQPQEAPTGDSKPPLPPSPPPGGGG